MVPGMRSVLRRVHERQDTQLGVVVGRVLEHLEEDSPVVRVGARFGVRMLSI